MLYMASKHEHGVALQCLRLTPLSLLPLSLDQPPIKPPSLKPEAQRVYDQFYTNNPE
jgi:hypothetical protein